MEEFPIIAKTDRLLLRRYRESDLQDLYEYLSDPEVVKYEPLQTSAPGGYWRRWDLRERAISSKTSIFGGTKKTCPFGKTPIFTLYCSILDPACCRHKK